MRAKILVRICLIVAIVGTACALLTPELMRQRVFRKKTPAALPQLLAVCSTAKTDPTAKQSFIRPMVLPLFRPQSRRDSWDPKDFVLRLIGDLEDDRQAFDPATIRTVVIVDWELRKTTVSDVNHEVWDATIIDIPTGTIVAQNHFDVQPDLISKTPQIPFGKWINSFPLTDSSSAAIKAKRMSDIVIDILAISAIVLMSFLLLRTFTKTAGSSIERGGQSPRSLYNHFVEGRNIEDIVAAAKAIDACLRDRDQSSDELMELLKPKVHVPVTGHTGRPLLDLTGGRPDTPEWIALRVIVDQENPYYDEYMSWIRRNTGSFDKTWIRTILQHLSATSEVGKVREQCTQCLGAM